MCIVSERVLSMRTYWSFVRMLSKEAYLEPINLLSTTDSSNGRKFDLELFCVCTLSSNAAFPYIFQ